MELYSDYKNVTHYITDMKSLLSNAFVGFMAETANPRGALDNDVVNHGSHTLFTYFLYCSVLTRQHVA